MTARDGEKFRKQIEKAHIIPSVLCAMSCAAPQTQVCDFAKSLLNCWLETFCSRVNNSIICKTPTPPQASQQIVTKVMSPGQSSSSQTQDRQSCVRRWSLPRAIRYYECITCGNGIRKHLCNTVLFIYVLFRFAV